MKYCIICLKVEIEKSKSYCGNCHRLRSKAYYTNRYDQKPYNGYIYIMTNPAWDNWVKIGRAINLDKRLESYNTSSPFRDFKIEYSTQIFNPILIERYFFEKYGKDNSEWFNLSVEEAIDEIERLKQELSNK